MFNPFKNHKVFKSLFSISFFLFLLLITNTLTSCTKTGIQGGDLKNRFTGISKIAPLSPTSIQLQWSLDSRYTAFKIYSGGADTPLKTETFSQSIIQNLAAGTTYSFTVTGVKSDGTGAEDGFDKSASATTLTNFSGINMGMLGGITNNSIKWKFKPQNELVTYRLYHIKRNGTWDFTKYTDSQISADTITLTASSLAGGTAYCFIIIAEYADGTSEPSKTNLTEINAAAPCVSTENGIPPADVKMNSTIPGTFPWFNITGGADTNTTVEIRLTSNDQLIASRKGAGEVRSSISLPPGLTQFYSITSTAYGKATSNITLEPTPAASRSGGAYLRSLVDDRTKDKGPLYPQLLNNGKGIQNLGAKIVKGDFNCDGIPDVAIAAPNSTPFGNPASPYIDINHRIKTGALIVYYGKKTDTFDSNGIKTGSTFALNTSPIPLPDNVAPAPQLIYFPMDSSNTTLGYQMAVGNINGDCQDIGNTDANGNLITNNNYCDTLWSNAKAPGQGDKALGIPSADNITTCDDLAVSSKENNGAVYVFYGNSLNGLATSSGTKTYGTNDFACVANGSCQAMKYTASGINNYGENLSTITNFGKALVFGDYNNDGFDDLAISANNGSQGEILVLSGSPTGLYPADQNVFPNISKANVTSNGNNILLAQSSVGDNFADSGTGFSLATAHDSRLCTGPGATAAAVNANGYRPVLPINPNNGTLYPNSANSSDDRLSGYNYDFTKCDDLVIGSPNVQGNRGSIFSCAAILSNSSANVISKWACQEHVPSTAVAGDQYGYSMIGIKNFNSYPMNTRTNANADIAGSVFVGSPGYNSNKGRVYGYYITPLATQLKPNTADASGIGGIQMILSEATTATSVGSVNQITSTHMITATQVVACNSSNTNKASSTKWWQLAQAARTNTSSCNHQSIDMSPALADAQFGKAFGVIPDVDANNASSGNRALNYLGAPMLAVAAPNATVLSSSGTTNIIEHGLVKLFKLDISNAVLQGTSGYPEYVNSTIGFVYGGGLNPFGPSTIYAKDQAFYGHFGLGGIVGGYFNEEKSAPFVQIIAGADGNNPGGVASNGSVSVFKTLTKQLNYTEQKCSGTCQSNVKDLEVNYNTSIETAYHYEMAQVVGDLNGDGYQDVVARAIVGDNVNIAVFYGSATGLVRSPAPSKLATGLQPLLLSFAADPYMGIQFAKIGSVNGDNFDDLLLIGSQGAYIYYGSFTGLVANVDPATAPNGTYPLWFGKSDATAAYNIFTNTTSTSIVGDITTTGFETKSYNFGNSGIAAEDFNGDGYADIAIGYKETATKNSILVFYGGANGLQVNKTDHAGIIQSGDVVNWTPSWSTNSTNCPLPTLATNGCLYWSANSNSVCTGGTCQILKIDSVSGYGFGNTITSMPPDKSSDSSNKLGSLVVSDLNPATGYSSLYIFTGTSTQMRKPNAMPMVNMNSSVVNSRINITQVAYAGDVNGDKVPDLIVTSSNDALNNDTAVRVLYGQAGNPVSYTSALVDSFTVINFINNTTALSYGMGVARAGDFNMDGYEDILLNVPKGNNTSTTTTVSQTGYVLVAFGGPNGIRKSSTVNAVSSPSITPKCYGGAVSAAICEPYQIFLPSGLTNEFTYISPNSAGDINGDGIIDILIGGFGRNNIYGNGYATGVVYVLY